MNSSLLKKALPHIIAIAVFLIVAVIYCKPALDGKVVDQRDMLGWKGMAQQSFEYKDKYGHFPLWTESMFSGMPAYNIAMEAKSKVSVGYISYLLTLGLPKPVNFFFLACACFYILTQVLRINPWVGILAAIGYAYCSFDPIIISVGHDTQMLALGYAPAVIGSLLLIFQRKYLIGAALFTVFFALQTSTQHLQVVYYTGIICGFISIAYLVESWKKKQIKSAVTGIAAAAVAAAIGFGTNALSILPVQEYVKETMRGGKSELTSGDAKNKTKGGLDKDYAFHYSYGIGETFTLLIPNIYGRSGGREVSADSKMVEKLTELGYPEETALYYANGYAYWGEQPGTAGPVYLGAVICFLFIFGLIYVKSWHKWWIAAAVALGILMAWGKNFSFFNYFLFDHLPFYNKFRAPTMALVIPQLLFPLLGALGLNQLLAGNDSKEIIWQKFKTSVFITGGILAVLAVFYFIADFKATGDNALKDGLIQQVTRGKQVTPEIQQQVNGIVKALQSDRQSLFGSDMIRSILLVAVAAVLMGAYLKGKIKPAILIAGLIVVSSYDLLAVGRRYLSEDNFVEQADFESAFNPTPADIQISRDPDKNFRVFDQTAQDGTYSDSRASYHHNSIGGYHPAKLGLYQDIIENQLSKGNVMVFNMLNTKYFIQRNPANGQPQAALNPNAFGPCWLVKSIHYVNDANEEMKALDSINVRDTAIVEKKFENTIPFGPVRDTTASIKLVENLNDKISYTFSSKTNQFAVFSEVYYDKGWDAYLDGKKTAYSKVDYILRGMPVPAGQHTIEFRFEPRSYELGNTITVWASIIAWLLLIVATVDVFRKTKPAA